MAKGDARGRKPTSGGDDTGRGDVGMSLNFGQLFKGLGGFLDLVAKLEQEGQQVQERTGKVNLPGGGQAVYGVSVRLGLGGKPVVQSFGHLHPEEAESAAEPVREPLSDVFDEGERIVVVAEVPGVTEKTIAVTVDGDKLSLEAGEGPRRYAKQIRLPAPVQADSLKHSYRNGILEIRMLKQRGPKGK